MAVSINLSITQNSQNKTNLTSNVTVKLTCKWTYGSWNGYSPSGSVTIDGTKYTFSKSFNTGRTTTGSSTLYTKTLNIKHSTTTGKKTLSCSASFATGVSSGTVKDTASKTLTQLPTIKITYNGNGGSGVPSAQDKYYDKTLTLSSVKPTRYGYTFRGWGTSTTDTTVDYNAGGSYTSNSSDTLYAIWSKSIALSYDANSGSGAPSSQSTTIYNATTSNTFTISSTTPTRVGYDFLGWSLDSTATSASYQPSASITLSDSDILYAIWRLKTYTISYNANGGINPPSSQTKTYGVNLTLTLAEPTRSGYKFLGWSTNSSSEEPTYLSGDTFVTNENTILYAIWEQLGIAYINIDGTFQAGKIWVNDYGTWMTGIIFVNDNGTWTQGGI